MRQLALSVLMIICVSISAHAHEYEVGDISVHHPYAYATKAGDATDAVFLTITNDGEVADNLVGVKTAIADKAEIKNGNEVIEKLEIKAHESKRFKPDGLQIVLSGLKGAHKINERKPMTLIFEKSGEVTVQILFSKPNAVSHCEDKH